MELMALFPAAAAGTLRRARGEADMGMVGDVNLQWSRP
jgi:hypothetical protein